MSAYDERVIEAAANAHYAELSRRLGTHDHPAEIFFEPPEETERAIFTAAISAADAARAPEIIAAVDRLIEATQAWNIYAVVDHPGVQLARRDVLAKFGIEESS